MRISWRHDIDAVLEEAKAQRRPALLDFSAALAETARTFDQRYQDTS